MRLTALLFLCLLIPALPVSHVFAADKGDCVADCEAAKKCDKKDPACAKMIENCKPGHCTYKKITVPQTPVVTNEVLPQSQAPHIGAFGAIAYDAATGSYGISDSSKDKEAAAKSATGYCAQSSKKCVVVENFSNTCAAIAQNEDAKAVVWIKNKDRYIAAGEALRGCDKKAGEGACRLTFIHCYKP